MEEGKGAAGQSINVNNTSNKKTIAEKKEKLKYKMIEKEKTIKKEKVGGSDRKKISLRLW